MNDRINLMDSTTSSISGLFQFAIVRDAHKAGSSVRSRSRDSKFTSGSDCLQIFAARKVYKMGDKIQFERLPTNVIPSTYYITIQTNFENLTFNGQVQIVVDVKESTNIIKLNCRNLTIKSVNFKTENDKSFEISEQKVCSDTETLTIFFSSDLPVGIGNLSIVYEGCLNDRMYGFYRTKNTFLGDYDAGKFAAVTHFEPTFAREAYPCWDEPAFKAVFNISLIVRKDETALSNMNVISDTETENSLRHVKFAPTPIMSTYITGFFVGKYDYVEKINANGLKMRVYSPIGKKEHAVFALETMEKVVQFYEDYFKISYPLKKLDLLAVSDMTIGAMENWGMIVFRERFLLVDPQTTSTHAKQLVAIIIAHEIAHMWFGNLVTMKWWTDLWLKEGFADFMEYLCIDHVYPQFKAMAQFSTDVMSKALVCDTLDNSHPIEVQVNDPSEIGEIFDSISYEKGASLIRMLHNMVGNEVFKNSLNKYLTQFSYQNTVTEDLWNSFENQCNIPVKDVMDTWTKQMGYPLLQVSTTLENNKTYLHISQKKFCSDSGKQDASLWMIPVSVMNQLNTDVRTFVMTDKETNFELGDVPADCWVKVNPGAVNYYRVLYSDEMLQKFIPCVKDCSMAAIDRLSLLDDYFALVKTGGVETVDCLKLMEAYTNETQYTVWSSVAQCLQYLSTMMGESPAVANLNRFGCTLMSNIFSKLGWDPKPDEDQLTLLLRSLVLETLVMLQDEHVLAEASRKFKDYVNGLITLNPDISKAVFLSVASQGDSDTLKELIELYKRTESQEQKNNVCAALTRFKSQQCIDQMLQFAISEHTSLRDMAMMLAGCGSGSAKFTAWSFFKENRDLFSKRFTHGVLLFHVLKNMTCNFSSQDLHDDVNTFFVNDSYFKYDRTIKQALEIINMNKAWTQKQLHKTEAWLQANY